MRLAGLGPRGAHQVVMEQCRVLVVIEWRGVATEHRELGVALHVDLWL